MNYTAWIRYYCFLHENMWTIIINKCQYAIQHNTLSHNTVLHVLVCTNHHQALFLQHFENTGTFETAIILLVKSHYIWLFIKIIELHHIYGLIYQNYDINKNKIEKLFIFVVCFFPAPVHTFWCKIVKCTFGGLKWLNLLRKYWSNYWTHLTLQ